MISEVWLTILIPTNSKTKKIFKIWEDAEMPNKNGCLHINSIFIPKT